MATTIQNIELPKKPRARDTSGNNNHGEIYSGRGLEFDGVSDYFQSNGGTSLTGVNSFADGTAWTLACWMSFGDVVSGSDDYCIGKDNASHPTLIYANGALEIRDANGNYFRFAGVTLARNTWYRVVIVTDGISLTAYVNGVLYGVISDNQAEESEHGSSNFSTTEMQFTGWGMPYQGGGVRANGFMGMMSDGQVWDTTWSATDAAYDYLNPESLALNASGSALTEGNLKLWYPMQDGHRGQQSYILDGANTGVGSKNIWGQANTNTDNWNNFGAAENIVESDTDADAVKITYVDGASGVFNYLKEAAFLTEDLVVGQTYKISIVTKVNQGSTVNWKISETDDKSYTFPNVTSTEFVTQSVILTATHATGHYIFVQMSSGEEVWIKDISVKAINDKHHATTVFTGDDLWDLADNSVANWAAISGSSEAVIGGTTDGIKLIMGGNANELGSYIYFKDTTTGTLTEDLTIGRTYKLSGKFATDVAGSTNAPRLTVYTNDYNYPSTATVPATNLVTNGTMEADSNWTSWSAADNERSNTQAHNGTYSRKFTPTSTNDGIQSANTPFTTVTGTTYLVSFWIYPDDGTVCSVFNRKGGEAAIGTTKSFTGLTQDAWNKVEMQFTEDVGGTGAYIIITSSTDDSGDFYVDDVVVTAFLDREITFTATNATGDRMYHLNCDYVAANEMISIVNDRNSIFDEGGQWVVLDASGGDASVAIDTAALAITSTTDNEIEGAQLPVANFRALEIGRAYTVVLTLTSSAGTPDVYIGLGGVVATAQAISDAAVTYAFKITPTNITGNLLVYTSVGTAYVITMDNVSIYPHCNLYVDDLSFKEVGVASGWTDADQQLDIPQPALQSYNELLHGFSTEASGSTHVIIADNAALNVGTDDFSLSLWFKTDDEYDAYVAIFRKGGWGGEGYSIAINNNNQLAINTANTGASNNLWGYTTTAIEKGKWYHVVGVWDRSANQTLYLNGVKQTMVSNSVISGMTGTLNNSSAATIYASSSTRFTGCITEVALFKTIALSDAEVLELYNDGKALDVTTHSQYSTVTGYWRNNGLSAWTDLSTNSNDGAVTGSETLLIPEGVDTTRDSQGFLMNKKRSTGSLNFPSRPQSSTEVSDFGDLDFGTGDFSMECWVQYGFINNSAFGETASGLNVILSNGIANSSSTRGFNLLTNSTDFVVRMGESDSVLRTYSFPGTPVVGSWYHLVVTRTGTTIETYLNGDDVGGETNAGWGSNVSTATPLIISNDTSDNRNYKWPIDSVKFYNKALDSTEVTKNYKATKGSHRN